MTNQVQQAAAPPRIKAGHREALRSGLTITAAGAVVTMAIYAWTAWLQSQGRSPAALAMPGMA